MKYLEIFIVQELFILYLEFKFNWVSYILYNSTSLSDLELMYHEYVYIYQVCC